MSHPSIFFLPLFTGRRARVPMRSGNGAYGELQREASEAVARQANDSECNQEHGAIEANMFMPVSMWCLCLLAAPLAPCAALSEATPVREADAKCAQCHEKTYQHYLATPMANASGLALTICCRRIPSQAFGCGIQSVDRAMEKPLLHFAVPIRVRRNNELHLSYFLGSGHLGTTYLYSINNYLFESPIAWYAASQGYDMKPGLAEMQTMPPPLPMQSNCLRCHMSSVQSSDTGTINRYKGLAFLHTGITCEACHGDSQQHLLTRGKSAIVNPAKLDADRRDSICISCHLEGDVSVERVRPLSSELSSGRVYLLLICLIMFAPAPSSRPAA